MKKGLKEQLKEAETELLDPPTSADELLHLLYRLRSLLSRVKNSPSKSMLEGIYSLTDAVVINHKDADVKVAVAWCFCELMRITAPKTPCDDENILKSFFEVVVSTFEDLYDEASRSYIMRRLILATIISLKSCAIMMELNCDGLIVEMFKHFLDNIRDYHPDGASSNMEKVTVFVIKESDDVSSDLLAPLLECLKKGNLERSAAAKLAKKVFEECAAKLKPYVRKVVKSLEDYTVVVTAVCNASVVNTNEFASADPRVQKMLMLLGMILVKMLTRKTMEARLSSTR